MPESGHIDANLLLLGRSIRRIREQRLMSTADLAGATGISRQRVDALETGQVDPTYELLLTLAEGLRVQPSALVTLAERLKESDEQ